jgi:hypothetical protein
MRGVFSWLLMLGMCVAAWAAAWREMTPIPFALHLHSRFSDGALSVDALVAQAHAAGYGGVLTSDHADQFFELGPFGVRRNSLRERGVGAYLRAVSRAAARHPEMLVLPGFEASPYYFWRGRFPTLTIHQWHRHLVVFGMPDPAAFPRLPMAAYGTAHFPPDAGEAPYLAFVRAVRAAGGAAYWAHPGGVAEHTVAGPVRETTAPYLDALQTVPESIGIAVQAPDDAVTRPGGAWDTALLAYVAGTRPEPAFVYVDLDYHRGAFPRTPATVLLLAAHTPDAAVEALRRGRSYVVHGDRALTECTLAGGDVRALPGETLTAGDLTFHYAVPPGARVRLIKNGVVVYTGGECMQAWADPTRPHPGEWGYYRLEATWANGDFLLTNPVWYHSRKG